MHIVSSAKGRLVELGEAECLALLASVAVGRVGISSRALPAILPVSFVLHGGDILFRTVPGTGLQAGVAGSVVAFEADRFGSSEKEESWSVLVCGLAEEITDPDLRATLDPLLPDSWAFNGGADHVIRIPTTRVTGRRLEPVPRSIPQQRAQSQIETGPVEL